MEIRPNKSSVTHVKEVEYDHHCSRTNLMRRDFHPLLLDHMRKDERIVVLVADLGYKMFDQIAAEFPNRFYNVGAAEQLALGVAVGLADEGKIPIVYSITPFLLYRPAEWIRNYLDYEKANVKLLAAGRYENGKEDYGHDGHSHWSQGDRAFLSLFPNIIGFWPNTVAELPTVTEQWLYHKGPAYLNLRR